MTGPRFLFIISFILLHAAHIMALTVTNASIEELTAESQLIVYGRVEKVEYQWENPDHKNIYTLVQIRVLEGVKGEVDDYLILRQLGGIMGEISQVISGTPNLTPGKDVVLFLVQHQGYYEIHSIALGIYQVFTNDQGRKMAVNEFRGVNLIDAVSGQPVQRGDSMALFEFAELLNQIRSHLKE